MPRWPYTEDQLDDDDPEDPEPPDYDDDEEPTIPCPWCGVEIHEDSERCPHCEKYVSREDAPPAPKPWWIYLGVVVCLFVVYHWITGRWW
jgi:hypothetical protein